MSYHLYRSIYNGIDTNYQTYIIQKSPSGNEQTPQPQPHQGHWPDLALIVVTFIPTIFLLLNFLISLQANSVLPAYNIYSKILYFTTDTFVSTSYKTLDIINHTR
jgi:hypothetical protein